MLYILFCCFLSINALGEGTKHDYRIETRKPYNPGYVCNYEEYHLNGLEFVLYTCVHMTKCESGRDKYLRRPELHFDNCNSVFFPPVEGGSYVCCHPQDNDEIAGNTDAQISQVQHNFMPGFRSAFKCIDYSMLVCLNATFCPDIGTRYRKGGTDTSIVKYPHLATIGYRNEANNDQWWYCLGSIVNKRFVLTSARCRDDTFGHESTLVRMGEDAHCMVGRDCPPWGVAQLIRIEKFIPHPDTRPEYYYHDLMLIRLAEDIRFNAHVRPACLFTQMDTTQGGGMFAMYEDQKVNASQKPWTIHEMEIQAFSEEVCSRWFAFDIRLSEPKVDKNIMFCAGLPHHGRVPCKFDYGGPLQIQEEYPYCMWQVYGVMSFSQQFYCTGNRTPIFTRVSYYLDWIEETVWPEFNMIEERDTSSPLCLDRIAPLRGNDGRCHQ